jgi:hypothetical protein
VGVISQLGVWGGRVEGPPGRVEPIVALTGVVCTFTIGRLGAPPVFFFAALPPRSMVGQLPLEQHIGVRIPGGQPMFNEWPALSPEPACRQAS